MKKTCLILLCLLGLCVILSASAECPEGTHVISTKITASASCETPAKITSYCTVCGKIFETAEAGAPLGHSEKIVVDTKPTCSKEGSQHAECSRCGKYLYATVLYKIPHTFDSWKKSIDATCQVKGEESRVCTACGEIETRKTSYAAHTPVTVITKDPDCTHYGRKHSECAVCGKNLGNDEHIPAIGHQMSGWTVTKAATCTDKGERENVCTRSGCTYRKTETIKATGHSWSAWNVTRTASCTSDGEKQRTCSACAKTETQVIKAYNHNKTHYDTLVKATITTGGERQKVCDLCGLVLSTEKTSPTLLKNNTICLKGTRLRDAGLSDDWYMFVPLALNQDGTYTFDLVASNLFVIGTAEVRVEGGFLTVSCRIPSKKVKVTNEFFTLTRDMRDLPAYDPETLSRDYSLPLNTPVPLNKIISSADEACLYLCFRADYTFDSSTMTYLKD